MESKFPFVNLKQFCSAFGSEEDKCPPFSLFLFSSYTSRNSAKRFSLFQLVLFNSSVKTILPTFENPVQCLAHAGAILDSAEPMLDIAGAALQSAAC